MQKIFLCVSLISLFSAITLGQNKKVVTNFDLEKFRQQRVAADADYERQAQSGKLPSKAELEQREQERQRFLSEFSEKADIVRGNAENYWQAQAYSLRTEIAATEAEINYVRARVSELPQPQVYYSVGYLPYGYGGYGNCCFGGGGLPQYPINRRNNIQVNNGQVAGSVTFGGLPRVNVSGYLGQTSIQQKSSITTSINGLNGGGRTNLTFGGIPYQPGILTAPFTLPTPQNLTREELLARLRLLEQQRAGLYARFEVLQDEARRNDVRID